MPDHYTYPGSEVLVNIPGYTDPGAWKEAETAVVGLRARELARTPVPGGFDLPHLQAIHARLVDGFYTWGGRLRDTNTGPGGTGIAHCLPEFIPAEAGRVFGVLADADYLRGRDRAAFAGGLATAWGDLTAVHPFRDVNTRSQFTFFNQLALEAGWVIDWNQIDPHVFAHARTVAIYDAPDGIEALLYPALMPASHIRDVERAERMGYAAVEFTRPHPPREKNALEQELRAALQRRQEQLDPEPPSDTGYQGPGIADRELGL